MRARLGMMLAMSVLGIALLTLPPRAPAGVVPGCCICAGCPSGGAQATCRDLDNLGGPGNCGDFCAGNCPSSTPTTTMDGTCADVAACQAAAPAGAPALDATGLTSAAALLAAIGVWQMLRRRRAS
ncbi:hypothetical protein KF840_01960 [bacterium]|nr:hypothetical protein [bacterium]